MFKKLFATITILFGIFLHAEVKDMSTEQLQQHIQNNDITIIDIRRPDEFKQFGIIQGSYKLTFFNQEGRYNIEKWMKKFSKIVTSKDQPFVLVCAHSNRTKVVGNFLSDQLKYKNVYQLKGGIIYGWLDKGLKTVK